MVDDQEQDNSYDNVDRNDEDSSSYDPTEYNMAKPISELVKEEE